MYLFFPSGCNAVVVDCWGKSSASFIHAFHMVWGIGMLTSPLIARPFLHLHKNTLNHLATNNVTNSVTTTANVNATTDDTFNVTTTTNMANNVTNHVIDRVTTATNVITHGTDNLIDVPIEYPITILCVVPSILAILTFFIYIAELRQKRRPVHGYKTINTRSASDSRRPKTSSCLSAFDPRTCTGGKRGHGVLLFGIWIFYYIVFCGGESCLFRYVYSFALKRDFSVDEATYLDSGLSVAFTIGRGMSAVLSIFFLPITVLFISTFGVGVSGIAFYILGDFYHSVVWFSVISLGLFSGPQFPVGISWANLVFDLTPVAMTIPFIAGNIGAILFSYLEGHLMDHYGAVSLTWMMALYVLLITIASILMWGVTDENPDNSKEIKNQSSCPIPSNVLTTQPTKETHLLDENLCDKNK